MGDYFISGKKGNGKSLVAVGRIRDALFAGRRVATNLDLNLEHLLPPKARKLNVIRLPDKPTRNDLVALGEGSPDVDESTYGVLVLDELATWLNARSFQDKTRAGVLDWLVHSRKWGWETYLIGQNMIQVDKQIREALVEYEVRCRRLDKLKIPFVGKLINTISGGLLSGNLPKIHVAGVFYEGLMSERWWYSGKDLYSGYDTRQKFIENRPEFAMDWNPGSENNRPTGNFSLLTPWHLVGRHLPPTWLENLRRWWAYQPPGRRPAPKLAPLMRLDPETRWKAAAHLVQAGAL